MADNIEEVLGSVFKEGKASEDVLKKIQERVAPVRNIITSEEKAESELLANNFATQLKRLNEERARINQLKKDIQTKLLKEGYSQAQFQAGTGIGEDPALNKIGRAAVPIAQALMSIFNPFSAGASSGANAVKLGPQTSLEGTELGPAGSLGGAF